MDFNDAKQKMIDKNKLSCFKCDVSEPLKIFPFMYKGERIWLCGDHATEWRTICEQSLEKMFERLEKAFEKVKEE